MAPAVGYGVDAMKQGLAKLSNTITPPERRRVQVPAAEIPGMNGLFTLAVFVVVVAALYLASEVLIPIVLAMLLSFLLAPLASLLDRLRVPHVASVLIAVLVALGVFLSLGALIGTQVAGLASDVPRYETTVEHKFSTLRGMTVGRLDTLVQSLGKQFQHAAENPSPPGGAAPTGGAPKPVQVQVEQAPLSPINLAMRIVGPVVAPLGTLLVVLIVAVFILLQREDLRDRAIRLFGSGDLHRSTMAMNDAAKRLSRYFLSQLAVNAGFGVIITAGLAIIGVPSPILWGIVGSLLRFVPYVGAWLAAALPLLLAAAVDPGWTTMIWTGALYGVTEFIIGQAVEPMLYGHSTGLSPFSVVVAATFWTWLWGPIGLILSTPLTLCLVVLGRHVERLQFLDVLLGDRPALSPVESFYQRMLAGDPDEAHAQAELLLRERSLSAYYEEVAIKGLQLAATDCVRGVLGERQLARVCKAARHLIDDLAAHDDVDPKPAGERAHRGDDEPAAPTRDDPPPPHPRTSPRHLRREDLPPPWNGEAPVLCLAGRGPLDAEAALILAQLLGKHGVGARVLAHEAASRDAVGQLDVAGVAMVCVCYLDLAGVPSHLRYLVRRLRQRLPQGVPILAGLWNAEDDVLADEELRATLGADHAVATLGAAVEACLAHASPGEATPASADAEADAASAGKAVVAA